MVISYSSREWPEAFIEQKQIVKLFAFIRKTAIIELTMIYSFIFSRRSKRKWKRKTQETKLKCTNNFFSISTTRDRNHFGLPFSVDFFHIFFLFGCRSVENLCCAMCALVLCVEGKPRDAFGRDAFHFVPTEKTIHVNLLFWIGNRPNEQANKRRTEWNIV